MKTTVLIIAIAIAVVVIVVMLAMIARQRRTTSLQRQFGPEYDRTVETAEGRRAAERDLRQRERERERLELRPLPEPTRQRYAEEWRNLQARFVDEPAPSLAEADGLLSRVMRDRGYPVDDFDAQADLVSVDHPQVVENYRLAHKVHLENRSKRMTTEQLRVALVRYRSLFDELLHPDDASAAARGEYDSRRDESTRRQP
jgi:hypothetical protein